MTPSDPAPPARPDDAPVPASHWDRVTEIFAAALEIPGPERGAWLAGFPDLDDDVRFEVASLLSARDLTGAFLAPGSIAADIDAALHGEDAPRDDEAPRRATHRR